MQIDMEMTATELRRYIRSFVRVGEIRLGTRVPWAAAVQNGRPPEPGKTRLPARPFIPPDASNYVAESAYEALVYAVYQTVHAGGPARTRPGPHFASSMIYNMFSRIHNAFRVKSGGGIDDMGIQWPELAASTIRRKARKGRMTFPESRRERWKQLNEQFRDLLSTSGRSQQDIDRIAAEQAWRWMQGRNAQRLGFPINVNTGRLEKSLRPGPLRATRYYPASADQVAEVVDARKQYDTS